MNKAGTFSWSSLDVHSPQNHSLDYIIIITAVSALRAFYAYVLTDQKPSGQIMLS
jgi:hypothetical protein